MTSTKGNTGATKELRVGGTGRADQLVAHDAGRSRGPISTNKPPRDAALIDHGQQHVAGIGNPHAFRYADPWCRDTGIIVDDWDPSGALCIRVCDLPSCHAAEDLRRAIASHRASWRSRWADFLARALLLIRCAP